MSAPRKVLLADPVVVSHSLLYYEAALASTGFEEAEFTLAAAVIREEDRQRVTDFTRVHPRMRLRLLDVEPGPCRSRWQCWRGFGKSMRATELMLRADSFDLVAYLSLDIVLVYFAFPAFRRGLRAHCQLGISGTLFRDNGLRPPAVPTLKARARSRMDLWILRRALDSGGIRKAAFLDHWCADRARVMLQTSRCGYGVDPIFPEPCDWTAARARFGLAPDDFVFLLFGVLSHRKGIIESLAMLRQAPLPAAKTVLIIAGQAEPEVRPRLDEELAAIARQYRVIRRDQFIERAEMPAYFAAADCVVCLYREFTGSSNVLLHAAAYGTPVLVCPGGAMEDAVRQHNFGEVVGWGDLRRFNAAASKLVALDAAAREAMAQRARAYAASMDARHFMSQFV